MKKFKFCANVDTGVNVKDAFYPVPKYLQLKSDEKVKVESCFLVNVT